MKDCFAHVLKSVGGAVDNDFTKTTIAAYPPALLIEPVHIDIVASIDFDQNAFHGIVTTTFKRTANANIISSKHLRSFVLHAVAFSNVVVSGAHLRDWDYDGKEIALYWDSDFAATEERNITITYDVIKPIAGLYFNRPSYTSTSSKHVIADHETERARYWLPCCDVPTVRTTLAFHITVPNHMEAFANGRLTKKEASSINTVYHYLHDFRCPSYLLVWAAGEFEVVKDESVDQMPIMYIASKGTDPKNLMRTFGDTPSIVRWMVKKLGNDFPWKSSKYFQIASEAISGAMECETLVTWQAFELVADENLWRERGQHIQSINVHEMGHSYFGDALVCRFFEHSWLKESWATAMSAFYTEDHYGKDEYDYEILLNAEDYFSECKSYVRPIVTKEYDHSWKMFDNHLYPGGASRIHALRRLLGDEAFWAGVQDYISTYKGKVVETDDFRKKLEENSGYNLTEFFDQWIYGLGYPKLSVHVNKDTDTDIVTVKVEQTQANAKKGIKNFTFDLDVEINTLDGKSYLTTVGMNQSRKDGYASVSLEKGAKLHFVRIDPGNKVFFELDHKPGVTLLETIARNSKDIRNRIFALRGLVALGSYDSIQKALEISLADNFYGVRAEIGKALFKSKIKIGIDAACKVLESEKDPRAQRTIVIASAGVRDLTLRDTLRKVLENTISFGPNVRKLCLQVLGKQQNPEDLEYLLKIAKEDKNTGGPWHPLRRGAILGLGGHGSVQAFKYLFECVKGPVKLSVVEWRDSLTALGENAKFQSKDFRIAAADAIAQYVNSTDVWTRNPARRALVTLGAVEKSNDILASKAVCPEQDWYSVLEDVKTLRNANADDKGGKIQSLTEQVEQLEEKVRKLSSQVETNERKLAQNSALKKSDSE